MRGSVVNQRIFAAVAERRLATRLPINARFQTALKLA
jgi:hypothetical protein